MNEIGERAERYAFYGEPASDGGSMLLDQAFALAAVEVIEGTTRPLRRERRRPETEFPGFPPIRGLLARRASSPRMGGKPGNSVSGRRRSRRSGRVVPSITSTAASANA